MKIFNCNKCGGPVFFENVTCLNCGHTLGYLPSLGEICAIEKKDTGLWQAINPTLQGQFYKLCANSEHYQICNWLVPAESSSGFCKSCELNELIPDLSLAGNVERWHKLEIAKRRALYTIFNLGLPVSGVPEENRPGLKFRFLGTAEGAQAPLTGHQDGVITLNINEADDPERERRRVNLHEPYRTILGHMRHETAHFFWDRLIKNSNWIPPFRELFGDENADYAEALKHYYAQDAPGDWQNHFVSAYASAHPWEDWAETWAHYFHIIDMIETAASFGVVLMPSHASAKTMSSDPAQADGSDFYTILKNWFPLTHVLNALNRGMGLPDGYPFVLSTPAIDKMRFIHKIVQVSGQESGIKGAS